MEHWYSAEIQRRRDELFAQAAQARMLRMLEGGRSSGFRERLAGGADSLSDLLAGIARTLRNQSN